jgi:uncharacterized tellurite resistance protein B-like protein
MVLEFAEKLAIIKMTTDVMKADGTLHKGEIEFLEQLKKDIGIDIPTVEAAEDMDSDSALITLNKLSYTKKKFLLQILKDVAVSDNFLHEKEMELILNTLINIGLGEELE